MDIDEMEGRELDALVAEKRMGFHDVHVLTDTWRDRDILVRCPWFGVGSLVGHLDPESSIMRYVSVPLFSTRLEYAFEVVEKMQRDGWWPEMFSVGANDTWRVCLVPSERNGEEYAGWGNTIQLAICRAALKAAEGG